MSSGYKKKCLFFFFTRPTHISPLKYMSSCQHKAVMGIGNEQSATLPGLFWPRSDQEKEIWVPLASSA